MAEAVAPISEPVAPIDSAALVDELKAEMPALLESMVRPLIGEMVKEMMNVAKEQLPGVVEKVIQEEIEKLKKIDV